MNKAFSEANAGKRTRLTDPRLIKIQIAGRSLCLPSRQLQVSQGMHKTLRPAAAAWARAANINDPIIGILVHLTQEAFDFSSLIHTAELRRLYDSAGVADARREEENAD